MTIEIDRRAALASLAGATAGPALGAGTATAQQAAGAAAAQNPPGVCVLFPQAMEGPYYFDPKLVRADIAEGRPGLPLTLALRVVELPSCRPIPGARVDVWHADAGGVYSGYHGQGDRRDVSARGQTFLRGTQVTGGDGTATFRSVYPGWYPGRTPHIHLKVFLDDRTVLTGQAYLPDDVSARIYLDHDAYKSRATADTTNAQDFIFKSGEREGGGIVMAMTEAPGALSAALAIAVDRSGDATRARGRRSWLDRLTGRGA